MPLLEDKFDDSCRPREECGIFAIYGHEEAARLAFFGLFALQHRGQESAGIVSSDGCQVCEHKGMGLASAVFKETILQKLVGTLAIGHVRYSTTGSSTISNAQPFLVHFADEYYALAHNGNIVNAQKLREEQWFNFSIHNGQRSHHPFDGAAFKKWSGSCSGCRSFPYRRRLQYRHADTG